jgi:hypothetical protein
MYIKREADIMDENIAFFSLEKTKDNKGVIGAILVTDDLGMPQEFRVTYPVKPTKLQERLYGNSLLVHIGITLCGEPLYKALKNKPELLLVSRRAYLPLATKVNSGVAHVVRIGETIVADKDGEPTSEKNIHSKSGRFQPIQVFFPPEYNEQEQKDTTTLLEKYFQGIDLIEPFDRIKSAVEALGEQDERFR